MSESREPEALLRNLREESIWLVTGSLVILAFVAVAAGLAYTQLVMVPFVIAIFLNTLVGPISDKLIVRLRFPKWAAMTVALLVVIAVLAIVLLLLLTATASFVELIRANRTELTQLLEETLNRIELEGMQVETSAIIRWFNRELITWGTAAAGIARILITDVVLISIFVGFMLASRDPISRPGGVYAEIDAQIRRYVGTKTTISAVTAILVWSVLTMFDLQMALLFGILAFLLNFIPSIGSIIATFLPLPVAMIQYDSIGPVIAVTVIPGAIQITMGNVVEPKIMGQGLNLHPVSILLSLALWGLLWGVIGMFLAVPITAAIRIFLLQFEFTAPIGRLLAGELPGLLQLEGSPHPPPGPDLSGQDKGMA